MTLAWIPREARAGTELILDPPSGAHRDGQKSQREKLQLHYKGQVQIFYIVKNNVRFPHILWKVILILPGIYCFVGDDHCPMACPPNLITLRRN